jgi:hypothetical protein
MIRRTYCRVIRKLLGVPPPVITREDAIRIAVGAWQKHSADAGSCVEVDVRFVDVSEQLRSWDIFLKTRVSFAPPWVVIDNQTGAVLRIGFPRR